MCNFRSRYDVVIAGARVAGAATALLLARAGARVLLIDRQARGSDTMSTHALMRTGVLQLERWGLLSKLESQGTPPIGVTTFHYGPKAIPIDIKPEHGVRHLYAPRRTVLDRILVEAAEAAGAEVHHGVLLSQLQVGVGGRVVGATLRDGSGGEATVAADLVIGADGRESTVAKLVAADTYATARDASAIVYGYFEGLPDTGLHWYFALGAAAGVIPTNHHRHCVFVGLPREHFGATFRGDVERGFFRQLQKCDRELEAAVETATLSGRLRGFAGAHGFLRQPFGAGWALVGDAGYFKDPLTAHGMTDALRDAELLARAVFAGGSPAMARYQQERDSLSMELFKVTDEIASFRWTLSEVKAMHGVLSAAMRSETNHMAQPAVCSKAA